MTAKPEISIGQENIHQKFKNFGGKCLEYRQKCIGLLPQIFKEKIYEKKGFESIFEYAAKLAGISREQVSRALNLHARFSDLTVFKGMLETGEVSVNKLARVASIATKENQTELAAYVKTMSQNAIETFVRDIRQAEIIKAGQAGESKHDLQKPLFEGKFVRAHNTHEQSECDNNIAHPSKIIELRLTSKNLEKLLELQGKGININEIIETALQNREEEISQDKGREAENPQLATSRYIPVRIQKIIDAEQGTKCAMPGCKKPAQVTHHELPFAMAKTHDPNHLKKLCKAHHEIAHGINIKIYEIKHAIRHNG